MGTRASALTAWLALASGSLRCLHGVVAVSAFQPYGLCGCGAPEHARSDGGHVIVVARREAQIRGRPSQPEL